MSHIDLTIHGQLHVWGITMRFTAHVTGTVSEVLDHFITEPAEVDVSAGPAVLTVVGIGTAGSRLPVVIDALDAVPAPFVGSFSGDQITLDFAPGTAPGTYGADISGDAH